MANESINTILLALKAVVFICDVLTFPVYLVIQQPWKRIASSQRMKAVSTSGLPAGPYQSVIQPKGEKRANIDGMATMYEIFEVSVRMNRRNRLFGTRDVLDEEDEMQPNGKVFKKLVLGKYCWQTYEEVGRRVDVFAKGLRSLGLNARHNVVLFAETRAEWMIACIACFKSNVAVVTLYATLGDDALVHGINETETNLVITSRALMSKFEDILPKTPHVKHLVYMEDPLPNRGNFRGFPKDVSCHSFQQVEWLGSEMDDVVFEHPTKDDTAVVMYTSGSTGVPKGVVITHANLMEELNGLTYVIHANEDDAYLAYLPLAHVLELSTEFMCIVWGARIGYSSPLTISDQSSKVKKGCKGDASIIRPTFLVTVPLILDRIYKSVNDVISSKGPLAKGFFDFAYNYKLYYLLRGFQTPIIDRLAFRKVRNMLGGRVRTLVAGGAPLSPETHNFIRVCMGCPVIQGYGLTETCSCATVMTLDDMTAGRVGAPLFGCEVLLEDWKEGNYRVTDKPHPRGEIVIGGGTVAASYYKQSAKIEGFFERDGLRWFRTGDIGEVHKDGCFKIIDRKKDLVKLPAGEYVSLGKVESELKTLNMVDNACVYADSFKSFPVALVVPDRKALEQLAETLDKSHLSFELLCDDKDITKALEKLIAEHGRKVGLEKFEVPARAKLVTEIWLPDSGLVTAAFKLKRKNIQEFYQTKIDALYA